MLMKFIRVLGLIFLVSVLSISCKTNRKNSEFDQYITVLGVVQDAGYPHINNPNEWNAVLDNENERQLVTSLGLVDKTTSRKWLFEATPDISHQLHILEQDHLKTEKLIDGVFLTHAHIGHYTGLMYFGREAMGSSNIPVYAMPRMKFFLENNGPWSQLVKLNNIKIEPLQNDSVVTLSKQLKITPFLVPHRDEYSETVGYKIEGINKSALFIPDINKWRLWSKNIIEEVKKVDYAFLDATFFKDGEVSRPMNEIPHPFIIETIKLFENEIKEIRSKVYFIHFNHSNPALQKIHHLKDSVISLGYHFVRQGDVFGL